MASALKLRSESSNELSRRIENEDRRMILQLLVAFMNHIKVLCLVDRDVMSCLPSVFIGKLWPLMAYTVLELTLAGKNFGLCLARGSDSGAAMAATAAAVMPTNSRRSRPPDGLLDWWDMLFLEKLKVPTLLIPIRHR